MNIFLRFLISSLISVSIYALNASLVVENNSLWLEGDTRYATLTIWPIPKVNIEEYKTSIEEKEFMKFFFLSRVKDIRYSKNNPEALVVNVELTAVGAMKEGQPLRLNVFGRDIFVKYEGPKIVAEKEQIKGAYVFEKELSSKKDYLYYFPYLLPLLLIPLILFFMKKRKVKKRIEQEKRLYKGLFLNASDRKSIEELYRQRKQWSKYISLENKEVKELLEDINRVQYKKVITQAELEEIKSKLSKVEVINDL